MPQEDQHATELNHPEKVSRVTFPAAADPAKVLQPGEQPLNLPSPQVAAQRPPILGSLSAATVGGNHLDAMFALQPLIQPIAVGGTISDPAFRQGVYVTLAQRVFDQGGLIRRSACNPDGDRKTMAVRDCHDLAPFLPGGTRRRRSSLPARVLRGPASLRRAPIKCPPAPPTAPLAGNAGGRSRTDRTAAADPARERPDARSTAPHSEPVGRRSSRRPV